MATSFPGIGGEDFDSRKGGRVGTGVVVGQLLAIGSARLALGTTISWGRGYPVVSFQQYGEFHREDTIIILSVAPVVACWN